MIRIQKLLFSNYPTKVKISESSRAIYYKEGDKIPKKHEGLPFEVYKDKKVLVDEWGVPIIKNAGTMNIPKFYRINGQDLYSLNIHSATRNKIVKALKEYYNSFGYKLIKSINPIVIIFTFYSNSIEADIDNHALFYVKTFIDFIQEKQFTERGKTEKKDNYIIKDDTIEHFVGYSVMYKQLNKHYYTEESIMRFQNLIEIDIKQIEE